MKRDGVSEIVTMADVVTWLAAEGDETSAKAGAGSSSFTGKNMSVQDLSELNFPAQQAAIANLPAHSFPGKTPLLAEPAGCGELGDTKSPFKPEDGLNGAPSDLNSSKGEPSAAQELMQPELPTEMERFEEERERRVYRGRTVGMLRRYMQYSIETGRLPSILGKEFFRAKVTSYRVGTFEDRVIFVHDMEICLARMDEFSRQLIARHILEEHDRWATARLLHCNEKTVRRSMPLVLDMLSEILLDVGLLERLDGMRQNSCQGGLEDENSLSDCEDGQNKF
jgi:hypothetical protein